MESSPKNNQVIEYVEGSPSDIIDRGDRIKTLGEQMLNSANVLESIKTQAFDMDGMQGKSIDVLRESIGDSYRVLEQAGELYKPVGPIIKTYGEALEDLQPKIRSAVDDCEDLWSHYDSLPGDKDGSTIPVEDGGFLGWGGHDADSPEAQAEADENKAAKDAYDDWKARAEDFDDYWESWDEAFTTAADGIGDEMSDSIKDGFWEVLGDIGDILGKIGLVVGIAALILGGPFTAIALALAAAALAVAVVQTFEDGKLGWNDLGNVSLAALGVVPFGKFGKYLAMDDVLGKGGKAIKGFVDDSGKAIKGFADDSGKAIKGFINDGGKAIKGFADDGGKAFKGFLDDGGKFVNKGMEKFGKVDWGATAAKAGSTLIEGRPKSVADGLLRAMHGQSLDDFTQAAKYLDELSPGKALLASQLDIVGAQGKHAVDVWQSYTTGRDWVNEYR